MKKSALFFIFLFLLNHITQAQEILETFPYNGNVRDISVGKNKLWVAHKMGFLAYDLKDGSTTIYNEKNSPIKLDTKILNVEEDGAGRVWVNTSSGIYLFFNNEWKLFTPKEIDGVSSTNIEVEYFSQDKEGNVCLFKRGFSSLIYKGDNWTQLGRSSAGFIQGSVMNSKGYVYNATERGAVEVAYNPTNTTTLYTYGAMKSNKTKAIAIDNNDVVWVAMEKGVARLEGVDKWIPIPDVSNETFRKMTVDSENNVWLVSYYGGTIWKINSKDNSAARVNFKERLSDISDLTLGKDGKIYIGTSLNGVYVVENNEAQKVAYNYGGMTTNSLQIVKNLGDGRMFIGYNTNNSSNGGYCIYDKGKITAYSNLRGNPLNVCKDSKGNVWVSTFRDGVYMAEGGDFSKMKIVCERLEDYGTPKHLVIDNKDNIWVAGEGASVAKYENGKFVLLKNKEKKIDWMFTSGLATFDNSPYVLSQKGVYIEKNGEWEIFPIEKISKTASNIYGAAQNSKGEQFFGLSDAGIMTKNGKKWQTIPVNFDNSSSSMSGLMFDKKDNLFVSITGIITKIDLTTNTTIPLNKINFAGYDFDDEGNLWGTGLSEGGLYKIKVAK